MRNAARQERCKEVRMASKQTSADKDRRGQIVAEARRHQAQGEQTYRAQALKLYPWIYARCRREFSGTKLRELTVHHKDHNHENNPPDGSNWELLCLYCHENEHARQQVADVYGEATLGEDREPPSTYRPFADLKELLQRKP
jgi:HNH endonuclease